MRYIAILDLTGTGDGYDVHFFENEEDARDFISDYACPGFVAVNITDRTREVNG